jgi:hypothetical protein
MAGVDSTSMHGILLFTFFLAESVGGGDGTEDCAKQLSRDLSPQYGLGSGTCQ